MYVGSSDRHLYAPAPDGQTPWAVLTHGPLDAAPAIGPDGCVYVNVDWPPRRSLWEVLLPPRGSKLYAVNPSGTLRWVIRARYYSEGSGGGAA